MSVPEPERSDGGYRRYGRGDEERLRFVRGVRRLGFGLGEIREVLALRDRGEPPCSYVAELIEQRAAEVDGQIAELERSSASWRSSETARGACAPTTVAPRATATSWRSASPRPLPFADQPAASALGARRP